MAPQRPGTSHIPSTDAHDILRAVKNAHYPADKDELIRTAQHSDASESTVRALRGIPQERYANRSEVVRSVRLPGDTRAGPARKTPIDEELER